MLEDIIKLCPKNEIARRSLIERFAMMSLGVAGISHFPSEVIAASSKRKIVKPSEKRVVEIVVFGGMSHLDSWDPKPNSGVEYRGGTSSIHSNTGTQISEYFPKMAKHMDKLALIRSMKSPEGDHRRATYLFKTSYASLGTITHPDMGAWANHIVGAINPDLPTNVSIDYGGSGGYLGAKASPFSVKDTKNPFGSLLPKDAQSHEYRKQLKLMIALGADFRKRIKDADVESVSSSYNQAIRLMSSESIKAFDISLEDKNMHELYNTNNKDGAKLLLARRLIEEGTRYVQVGYSGWDHHDDLWGNFPAKAKSLDNSLSAFMSDLEERGLLKNTTIAFKTEFGRTPKHSDTKGFGPGRGHYPKAFSTWIAGAGVKQGIVYGGTDERGENVLENPVSPMDYNATLAQIMGISLGKEIYSPDNRPFTIAREGKVIKDILA